MKHWPVIEAQAGAAGSVRAQIVTALRDAIEFGLLQPGERIVERDLCERLAVSRSTIREALRELEVEGVLRAGRDPGQRRGLIVAVLSVDELRGVYELRAALEALVARQFIARAQQCDHERLGRQGADLVAAYRSGGLPAILSARRGFYEILCDGAANPPALVLLAELTLRTSQFRGQALAMRERQRRSVEEIQHILDAIEARDAAGASKAIESHIASTLVSALENAVLARTA